jgi:hypothetical protein
MGGGGFKKVPNKRGGHKRARGGQTDTGGVGVRSKTAGGGGGLGQDVSRKGARRGRPWMKEVKG